MSNAWGWTTNRNLPKAFISGTQGEVKGNVSWNIYKNRKPSWINVFSGSTVGTITMEYSNDPKSVLYVNICLTPCFNRYQKLS